MPAPKLTDEELLELQKYLSQPAGGAKPAAPLSKVYRNDPNALRGLETADIYPDRVVLGRRPDADRTALDASGYSWRPVDDYETVVAHPQAPVSAPPGKLPFISGTPNHEAKPGVSFAIPPSPMSKEGVDQTLRGAAASAAAKVSRQGVDMPPAPVSKPKAQGQARRSIEVKTTSETGPQPTLRQPQDLARLAPGLERIAAKSPAVAEAVARKLGLSDYQAQAADNRTATRLGRAFAMAGEAISGAKYDRGAYDDLEQGAEQPVTDYLAREQEARAGRSEEAQRAEAARRAQLDADQLDYQRKHGTRQLELQEEENRLRHEEATQRQSDAAADRRLRREEMTLRASESTAARKDMADQKRKDMLERQDEKDQAELSKRLGTHAALKDDLERIMPYVNSTGDVPGVGPVVSALPEFMLSQQGTDVRQSALRLFRNVVRAESGQTVTPQEAATALEAMGMGPGKSEAAWRGGMASLARRAQMAMRNVEAGFSPAVVQEYGRRGGVTSADIPQAGPRQTGRTITRADGSVWAELENGEAEMIRPPRSR